MPRKLTNTELAIAFAEHNEYLQSLIYSLDQNSFYLWDEYYYRIYDRKDFENVVWKFMRFNFPNQQISMSTLRDIIDQIKMACLRRYDSEDLARIAFKDIYYNLDTFTTEQADQSKLVSFSFPFFYDLINIPTPNFTRFLESSFVEREDNTTPDFEVINLIQEMFGYLLINNLKTQVAFFLVGKGSNGKGVLASIIEKLIGERYMHSLSIQSLTTDKFATAALLGKRVNLSGEEESKFIRSDRFKALVAGDRVDGEFKFGEKFSFRPYVRFLFTTNEMPVFDGLNYGLLRRFKIIPMYRVFKGTSIDRNLVDKILPEMPGIVKWALEGARRLVLDNDYSFSDSRAERRALSKFEEDASTPILFIRSNSYVVDCQGFMDYDTFYILYRTWVLEEGRKAVSRTRFVKELCDNVDGVERKVGRSDGKVVRGLNFTKVDIQEANKHYENDDKRQQLLLQ